MLRPNGWFALMAAVAALPVAVLTVAVSPSGDVAQACTGGGAPFESFATETELIVLVTAVDVGDAVNHAPTVTASATPSATATSAPSVTPSPASPPQPTPYRPDPGPVDFDLRGIGVTFRVDRAIAGSAPQIIEYQRDYRTLLEAEIRRREAGAWSGVESCGLGAFTVRYEQGRQYLLFFNVFDQGMNTWASFPVDDGFVVLNDPLHLQANFGALYMQPDTLARYFLGVAAHEGFVDAPRVPLNMLLRAVAALRGDPSIAPPDAGSAGLKDLTP